MAGTKGIRAGRAFVELFADDSRLVMGLRGAQRKLLAFGASVRRMGQTLLTSSLLAAAPLAISVKIAAGFEAGMARVKALTGATGAEFKALGDLAREMGKTTVFTARQSAEAMQFFALAGFETNEIMKAMKPTLDLAAAGQIEIAEAADIAAKVMGGMGIAAEDLGHSVDVLAKAMTTSLTDITMLGEAMKFIGPVAQTAGIGLEEIVAVIQVLSDAGIQGAMAGTSLRGMLLTLVGPSAEGARAMRGLGIDIEGVGGKMLPLADIVRQFNRGLDGMGEVKRLNVLKKIFPARQVAGIAKLLEAGGDQLEIFVERLKDAGGTAASVASIQLDTLAGDATILKSALEGLAISVGTVLIKPLRAASQWFTKIAGATTEWFEANRHIVFIAAAVVMGIAALGTALIVTGVALAGISMGIGVFTTILGAIATILTPVVSVLGAFGAMLALLASPIVIVVAALVAIGVAFFDMGGDAGDAFDQVKKFTGGVWDQIMKAAKPALDWISGAFKAILDIANKTWTGIKDALLAGDIPAAAKVMWASLKLAWVAGTNLLKGVWTQFKNFVINMFTGLWAGVIALAEEAFFALQSIWIDMQTMAGRAVIAAETAKEVLIQGRAHELARISSGDRRTSEFNAQRRAKRGDKPFMSDEKIRQQHLDRLEFMDQQNGEALLKIYENEAAKRAALRAKFDAKDERNAEVHRKTLEGIGRKTLEGEAAREKERGDDAKAANADLIKAQLEFDAAVDGARRVREAVTDHTSPAAKAQAVDAAAKKLAGAREAERKARVEGTPVAQREARRARLDARLELRLAVRDSRAARVGPLVQEPSEASSAKPVFVQAVETPADVAAQRQTQATQESTQRALKGMENWKEQADSIVKMSVAAQKPDIKIEHDTKRIADATEDTAKEVAGLRRDIVDSQLVFG